MIKMEFDTDMITIVSEPGALTFCTRKEWRELPECSLGDLGHHQIDSVFYGSNSLFFLLKNLNLFEYHSDPVDSFHLVKVTVDEETGKQIMFIMCLSNAETTQLKQNRITLWE